MKNLNELFLETLAHMYSGEQQLIKALPKLAEAAHASELKEGIENHLHETEGHARRLERVFEMFDTKPKAKKCKVMAALISEGEDLAGEDSEPALKDAGIIAAAQQVEHFEIATYGTLCAWAELLGNEDAVALLEETKAEEKKADEALNQAAETINPAATQEAAVAQG